MGPSNKIPVNLRQGSLQAKVYQVLQDKEWHCRGHEYKKVPSGQLAGGGGMQGLQRGTKSRPGLEIMRRSHECVVCNRKTVWDRWTGTLREANASAGIPKKLLVKIFEYYNYQDEIEQRVRPIHELIVDHRVPMERWGTTEDKLYIEMTPGEIQKKFQILKKDSSGNHNLLKSRACESCIKTGKRGTPLGIRFFYKGSGRWPKNIPQCGAGSEKGCVGCGWYDFSKWRQALNRKLTR